MKTDFKRLILITGVFFISFSARSQGTLVDSIPFAYNYNNIVIDAIINDTIRTKVLFDTGTYGLLVVDSLNVYDGSESKKYLQIGNIRKEYYDYPKGILDSSPKENPVFRTLGVGAVAGWEIFEDKIIQISYKDKCIKVFDNIEEPIGYSRLEMRNENNCWGVPGTIILHGKCIEEYVLVDTGNGTTLTLNAYIQDKYAIDLTNTQQGYTSTTAGREQRSIVTCDTIKVGDSFMVNQRVAFRDISRRSPFAGLLGNSFLGKQELILDFKNGICYIKTVEQ